MKIDASSGKPAYWESQIGSILKIGSTYVNTHRYDAESVVGKQSQGVIPRVMENGLRKVYAYRRLPEDDLNGALIELTQEWQGEKSRLSGERVDNLLQQLPSQDVSAPFYWSNEMTTSKNRSWIHDH